MLSNDRTVWMQINKKQKKTFHKLKIKTFGEDLNLIGTQFNNSYKHSS